MSEASSPADSTRAVDALIAALVHPFRNEVERIRALFLRVDPSIAEGIKWNAPGFRTSESLATTNLRSKTVGSLRSALIPRYVVGTMAVSRSGGILCRRSPRRTSPRPGCWPG